MNKLLSSIGLAMVTLLAGCSLYFGNSNGNGNAGTNPGGGSDGNPPGYSCSANGDCAPGCFCQSGTCAEGGFCATDKDCGNGFHCDAARSSCIPNPPPPAELCLASVTCATSAPTCDVGQVPLVKDGCYTGACRAIAACEAAPACAAIQHEGDCMDRSRDCTPVYSGFGCTKPDGSACHVGDTNCNCTSFAFAMCVAKGAGVASVIVAD